MKFQVKVKMAKSDLPDLDYVDRCITSLKKVETSSDGSNREEISAAIKICKAYKTILPRYQAPIESNSMPKNKKKQA